jgi:hypothetical protein
MSDPNETDASRDRSAAWPSADEIYRMIREAAYLKAEARNFAPGVEMNDWLEAEKEVLERLRQRAR